VMWRPAGGERARRVRPAQPMLARQARPGACFAGTKRSNKLTSSASRSLARPSALPTCRCACPRNWSVLYVLSSAQACVTSAGVGWLPACPWHTWGGCQVCASPGRERRGTHLTPSAAPRQPRLPAAAVQRSMACSWLLCAPHELRCAARTVCARRGPVGGLHAAAPASLRCALGGVELPRSLQEQRQHDCACQATILHHTAFMRLSMHEIAIGHGCHKLNIDTAV
jgi:hypothetical protein